MRCASAGVVRAQQSRAMRSTILWFASANLVCILQIFIEPGDHTGDLIDLVFALHKTMALLRIIHGIPGTAFLLQEGGFSGSVNPGREAKCIRGRTLVE
jgi:hypothetical protein